MKTVKDLTDLQVEQMTRYLFEFWRGDQYRTVAGQVFQEFKLRFGEKAASDLACELDF